MKPQFSVSSNGQDITSQISDRLLRLSVKDEAGLKSDTCQIDLDDRGQDLALPVTGVELEIKLGYETLTSLGKYAVDEVKLSHPPSRITVRGKSMPNSLKNKKTRSWDDKQIGEIVSDIAAEHGLGHRVASEFQGIKIEHLDQTDESDAHFLTRIAKEHGAVAKPAGNMLLFIPKGEGKAASGAQLSTAVVNVEECTTYSCTQKDRGQFQKVIAKYQDKETGTEKTVEAAGDSSADDDTVTRIKKIFPTMEEAQDAANAEALELKTGKVEIDLSIIGRPDIFAERPIKLQGFRNPPMGGSDWIITSVTHEFSERGYTTKISCSNKG